MLWCLQSSASTPAATACPAPAYCPAPGQLWHCLAGCDITWQGVTSAQDSRDIIWQGVTSPHELPGPKRRLRLIWEVTAMFRLDFSCEASAKISLCTRHNGPINLLGNFSATQTPLSFDFNFQMFIFNKIKITTFSQFPDGVINQQGTVPRMC